jgi:hypothetical protein
MNKKTKCPKNSTLFQPAIQKIYLPLCRFYPSTNRIELYCRDSHPNNKKALLAGYKRIVTQTK